jgi:hypothetical protein
MVFMKMPRARMGMGVANHPFTPGARGPLPLDVGNPMDSIGDRHSNEKNPFDPDGVERFGPFRSGT